MRNAIRYFRKQRQMSQTELAAALGLRTHSTVSRYERGQCHIPSHILVRLADVLDVSVDTLLCSGNSTPLDRRN